MADPGGAALTPKQQSILREYGMEYQSYSKTPDGMANMEIHRRHEEYLKEKLSKSRLKSLSESELVEICNEMWAFKRWKGNERRLREMILEPNGIRKIREGLQDLLYGEDRINRRFDRFKLSIKGLATSSMSEILNFAFPTKYFLWNGKRKDVLPKICANVLPDSTITRGIRTGDEYMEFINAMRPVRKILEPYGVHDFVDLDAVFWYIHLKISPKRNRSNRKTKRQEKNSENRNPVIGVQIKTHQSAQYHLLALGKMMSYRTYTPDRTKKHNGRSLGDEATLKKMPRFTGEHGIEDAEQIDVIWFDKYDNPEACFEVEHTTRVRTGLDRFIPLNHHTARFFIVAEESERSRFIKMMKRNPYSAMHNRIRFLSYNELVEIFKAAAPFHELRDKYLWTPET